MKLWYKFILHYSVTSMSNLLQQIISSIANCLNYKVYLKTFWKTDLISEIIWINFIWKEIQSNKKYLD